MTAWTAPRLALLRRNWGALTPEDFAELFGVSPDAVRRQARRLGLAAANRKKARARPPAQTPAPVPAELPAEPPAQSSDQSPGQPPGQPTGQPPAAAITKEWPAEAVAELTRLWGEGLAGGVIARRLGKSKNAVVGKAGRLGLDPRPSPIKRNGRAPQRDRFADSQRAAAVVTLHPEGAPAVAGETKTERRFPVGPVPQPAPFPRAPHSQRGLSPFATCQWIKGNPSHDDACKCGAPVAVRHAAGPRGVYCPKHAKKAVMRKGHAEARIERLAGWVR